MKKGQNEELAKKDMQEIIIKKKKENRAVSVRPYKEYYKLHQKVF